MTTDKRGVSALLVQRQLDLSRYETAWMMLHKLRRAMGECSSGSGLSAFEGRDGLLDRASGTGLDAAGPPLPKSGVTCKVNSLERSG